MCAYIQHKYSFALVCIEIHRVLELEKRERNVMLARGSTVSLVVIITHYLFLLLHKRSLFTQSLSFLCSHLGCLSSPC